MPSTSTHSRLEVPARGWTRTDRTRPATRTRSRHCASPMGSVPADRRARARSAGRGGAPRGPVPPGPAPGRAGPSVGGRPWPSPAGVAATRVAPSCRPSSPARSTADTAPPSTAAAARAHRLRTLKGTMVALTWGTWLTTAAIWSAVRSCRKRCQADAEAAAGQEHGALGVPVGHRVGHQLDGRPGQAPVGALDDVERAGGRARAGSSPPASSPGHLGVDVEVDGPQVVGGQGPGVLDGPGRGQVEPVDQHDDDVAAQDRGLAGPGRPHLELLCLVDVLAVQADEAPSTGAGRRPRPPRRPR